MSSYNFSHGHIEEGQHRKHKHRNSRYLPPTDGHEQEGAELTSQQKWLSISALGGHADKQCSSRKNFARLRKGYASMRKSFRVLGNGLEEQERGYSPLNSTSLINQIGSNAARLMRRGVTQVRLNKIYADNNDAIQCTDGSFKIISPGPTTRSHYYDDPALPPVYANLDAPEQLSATTSQRNKSEAEREVDMRLRRSKRRVLPSARYKAPNSERACEGLDLEELEEIKRDNLRLTLRSQKAGLSGSLTKPVKIDTPPPSENTPGDRDSSGGGDHLTTHENNVEPYSRLEAIVCSCQQYEGQDEDERDGGDSKHYYCSCVSISSFSCESEKSANSSQVDRESTTETPPPVELARTPTTIADEFHEQFVNLLAEGRKALSQPNLLSYFAYANANEDSDGRIGRHQTDDDKNVIKRAEGVAVGNQHEQEQQRDKEEGEKTIECESEREQEKVKVMRLQEEATADHAHASSVTLNVRELEKLCGDLVKSCAQREHEQEQLCDVVVEPRDGDDYHNEMCPADDVSREQQREVTTCCCCKEEGVEEEELAFTNLNEQGSRRATRVAAEQVKWEAKHKYRVAADLDDNASALRSSCQQQVGGVSRPSNAGVRSDRQQVYASRRPAKTDDQPSDAEQQQRTDRAPPSLAASRTANNQSDRDLHGKQRTAADFFGRGRAPDTTCGGAANLTSGHVIGTVGTQKAAAPTTVIDNNNQQQAEQLELEKVLRNTTSKCQVASNTDEPTIQESQVDQVQAKSPIYQTLQESNQRDDKHRESERRRRQQLRRKEIMLSLTGQPEHLWHELVVSAAAADGVAFINERAIDTRPAFNPLEATYGGPPQATTKENIYSSLLYEELAQGHFNAPDSAVEDSECYETRSNYQKLQDKERRLFEEQINDHLRIIKDANNHQQRHKPHKRSLLSKLKNLLAPTASATNSCAKGERDTFAQQQLNHKTTTRWMTSSQNVSTGQTRWDDLNKSTSHLNARDAGKSRTLGSMSTQNLFNSSMRYLSASRKSINLASSSGKNGNSSAAAAAGEMDGSLFSSKSFISGFLTLGRRSGAAAAAATTAAKPGKKAPSSQKKQDYESLSQLFRRNQHNGPMHRGYGSFDSLPSADSGLSCSGHLQNTSSCDENNYATTTTPPQGAGNIYSCSPPPVALRTHEKVEQQFLYDDDEEASDCDQGGRQPPPPPAAAMVAVGRARAKVDCNPCAYDKEALVFKKGDLIDILERHQSGTWIGRCNGQVGHFKFINVTEIRDPDAVHDQRAPSIDDVTCLSPSPDKQSGPYVTKLEIKNENSSNSPAANSTRRRSHSSSSSSSSSMAHQDHHRVQEQQQRHLETSASKLANTSDKTLVGSLEQLLASIGLDNCRQARSSDDRSCSCDNLTTTQPESPPASITSGHGAETNDQNCRDETDLSYLEILERAGINSLDAFSAIEQLSDLKRIGIIDDEHQRRLLMAAKIIRQALKAAKLDLQQRQQHERRADTQQLPVCKSKPITAEGGGSDSSSARQPPPPPPLPPSDRNSDKTERLRREHNQPVELASTTKTMGANERSGDGREPVYVNLLSTNKIASAPSTGQSAAASSGCNESARAGSGQPVVATTSNNNKSISKPSTTSRQSSLTTFGTNFLFNDLSQVETVELASGDVKLQLDYDHNQDHNECQPVTITNQRSRPGLLGRNLGMKSRQEERTSSSNTGQRSVQLPHLVNRDCTTRAAVVPPKRGVNNSPDSVNRADKEETDCYQIVREMQDSRVVAADENNNQQADHKGNEPSPRPAPPPPPFTRGCSVRVSSRKPKRVGSRLTSREPRRGSQDCSRIYHLPPPAAPNSVGVHPGKQPSPAHCSIRSLQHRGSSSDLNPVNLNSNQLVSHCTFNQQQHSQMHAYPVQRSRPSYQRVPQPPPAPRAPTTHDSYHHLLNQQSAQIMNSKSAYDLHLNFSKFLEN